MAQADDSSSTPRVYAPLGMCFLRDVLAGSSEDERGTLGSELANDYRWAFGLGPNGLIRIEASYWVTPVAFMSFDSGTYMHCCPDGTYAALPIVILCAGAPEATDDTVLDEATDDIVPEYIPPFMVLMHEAVREFEITAANPSPGNKEDMTAYFTGKIVEGSKPISPSMAEVMATLIRAPEAMSGGRKSAKKGGDNW